MSESIKNLKTITKLLPCKLTDEELLGYGNDLATVIQDMATEEDRQVSLKQELKARLTDLESRRSVLSNKITRKEEVRDVEVEPSLDFDIGAYRETRTDTGEMIFERPINEHEQQEQIELTGTE